VHFVENAEEAFGILFGKGILKTKKKSLSQRTPRKK